MSRPTGMECKGKGKRRGEGAHLEFPLQISHVGGGARGDLLCLSELSGTPRVQH